MENSAKEKLINAAIELFALEGYGSTSIRQIAQKAGVNSSLISYYFKGKQGLYNTALENQFDTVLNFVKKASSEKLDPEDVIKEYANTIAQLNKKSPLVAKIIFRELLEPSQSFKKIINEKIGLLLNILSDAIEEGINRKIFRNDIDTHYIVLMVAGIVNFYFFSRPIRSEIIAENKMVDEIYIEKAINVLLKGIKNP